MDGNEGIGVGNKFVNLKPPPIWQIPCLKQYKKKYKLKTADKSANFQMKKIEIKIIICQFETAANSQNSLHHSKLAASDSDENLS